MAKRTTHLPALLAAAALLACALALLAAPGEAGAAFPGSNGRIAFSAEGADDGNYEIFTVRPDGTGTKRLTDALNGDIDVDPSYSADGRKIAFNRRGDLWIMDADGTGQRRLTRGSASDSDPAFSPGGRKVAFARYNPEEKSRDIYLKPLDGGAPRRVTDDRDDESEPAFSPDGRRIAFVYSEWRTIVPNCPDGCSGPPEIASARPDGTGRRVLTDLPQGVEPGAPDFSPDGSEIAFSVVDYRGDVEQTRIETMDADGSGQRTVFAPDGSSSVFAPAFSPDGSRIAFLYRSGYGSEFDIWTVEPDGAGPTNVTETPEVGERTPDWRPRPSATG